MKHIMKLVAALNLIMGGFLLYDAAVRLSTGQQLLIFDEYLGGFARVMPILLGISMILASVLVLLNKSSAMVFYSYINSFLFLLFYTPSVFYSGIKERYSPWIIVIQFVVLITCTILLFTTGGKGKETSVGKTRKTLQEHKLSMKRFLDHEEVEETAEESKTSTVTEAGEGKQ